MKKSTLEALKKCKLFKTLNENELTYIAENYSVISTCEKNEVIFSETQYTRSLVIITKGRATVKKNSGSGKILMNVLNTGDVFGMAAMFYEKENFLTEITAAEKVSLMIISKENLINIFKQFPVVTENYITILSEKIHFLNKKISTYTKPEASQKVAAFILQCQFTDENTVTLPISITDIADTLNTGRASVYRAFDVFEKNGIIKRQGKVIKILDKDALENQ